jgi:hypothetical protein
MEWVKFLKALKLEDQGPASTGKYVIGERMGGCGA